ncbi:MAG: sulfate transporter CysZ [Magnetococcales bacterium]|nr:sulfate transporter CysZ [Magnetococcales bacterium]MBF0156086.1 sulfate transporter CysZ [Magnetococcales bacterium]
MPPSPVTGIGYLLRGLRLIAQPGIRRFVAVPLLISALLFTFGSWLAYTRMMGLVTTLEGWFPQWLSWLSWLLVPLFVLTVGVILFFGFNLLANFIGAPFNALLADRVERHLLGGDTAPDLVGSGHLTTRLFPLLANELGKLFHSLFWLLPLAILFLIPLLNLAAPWLWFLFTAWITAVDYLDLPMGNHNLSGKEVRRRLRQRPGIALTFGASVQFCSMIPLLNFLVMPAAVAGATAIWVDHLRHQETPQAP